MPENENEILQVSEKVNSLLKRVEYGIREQKQFSEDASQEMKTFLTAIRGMLEVLIRRNRDVASYETKIKETIFHVDLMTARLDQAFLLCWLNSGKVSGNNESINLLSLLGILEDKWLYRMYANRMSLHINIPSDLEIISDCYLLEIILDQIIGDAVMFGRKWGNIYAGWNDRSGTLSVSNDGYGISSGHQILLMEQYKQLESSENPACPGNGLGMAIVMKVAALMNTHLSFNAHEGKGAAFTIQFFNAKNLSRS